MTRRLNARVERFPIAGSFTIARGSRTESVVVVAEIIDGVARGRGECVPYARFGESVEGVLAAIEATAHDISAGLDRETLRTQMHAGAARNALDCALWDLEAKRAKKPAHVLAKLPAPQPVTTAFTISLGSPDAMAAAAAAAATRPLLKVKLGAPGDPDRIAAVRHAAPTARLVVDANEGWTAESLGANLAACVAAGVELIEQPLPAGKDAVLSTMSRPVPVCADESVHDTASLPEVIGCYDAVNIKLDKAGGLTEALALAAEAERRGLAIMVGCMLGTSLAMAPALLLAPRARWVDLDGPLLLAQDRPGGLRYQGSLICPPSPALWG